MREADTNATRRYATALAVAVRARGCETRPAPQPSTKVRACVTPVWSSDAFLRATVRAASLTLQF